MKTFIERGQQRIGQAQDRAKDLYLKHKPGIHFAASGALAVAATGAAYVEIQILKEAAANPETPRDGIPAGLVTTLLLGMSAIQLEEGKEALKESAK